MYKTNEMPKRYPIDGTFELTIRCNLHCKMCLFRHDDSENADIIANELSSTQWIDLAKQVAEAGTGNLLITGGEPMLRSDFCEIWEGIYKQGFIITLYTNATLVTPKIMETLKKYPPHKIGITIYGASPETYSKVCGNSIFFQKMIKGVHLLQTLPSIIEFRTTIIKDNFNDVNALDCLAKNEFKQEYGVKQSFPVNKAVRGACANVEFCRVEAEEDVKMKIQRTVNEIHKIVGEQFNPKNLVIKRQNSGIATKNSLNRNISFFGCQAGVTQYTITYDGKLIACQMIDMFSIDVLQNTFQKAWEQFPHEIHIPSTEIKCDRCEFVNYCQSCYASRYAETGDFNGCSKYIYDIAKARYKYENNLGGFNNEKE